MIVRACCDYVMLLFLSCCGSVTLYLLVRVCVLCVFSVFVVFVSPVWPDYGLFPEAGWGAVCLGPFYIQCELCGHRSGLQHNCLDFYSVSVCVRGGLCVCVCV